MNKQRENIYALRREILEGKIRIAEDEVVDTREYLMTLAEDIARRDRRDLRARARPISSSGISTRSSARSSGVFAIDAAALDFSDRTSDEIRDVLWEQSSRRRTRRRKSWSAARSCERVERDIMLQIVDAQWKDHLYSLDHLKEGIGLRGYGQRDPLVEYKKESFELFQAMKERVDEEIVRYLWWLRPVAERGARRSPPAARAAARAAHPEQPVGRDAVGPGRRAARAAAAGQPVRAGARAASSRPASAATTRPSRRCAATSRRSAATIRARAAAARSTRSVTERPLGVTDGVSRRWMPGVASLYANPEAPRTALSRTRPRHGAHLRRRAAGAAALDRAARRRSTSARGSRATSA